MTKIIAFSGRKQSGKSTSGEYIQQMIKQFDLSISYKLYSFADPLKQNICMDLLGLTYDQCYGSDEDKNSLTNIKWSDMPIYNNISTPDKLMTAREVMEFIGTGIFRRIKNNIWVDATMERIKKEALDLAIILDNRFPNEVDSVLSAGGYVIRLTRDLYGSTAEAEIALDKEKYDWSKFSLIIDNQTMTLDQKNQHIYKFLLHKGILPL